MKKKSLFVYIPIYFFLAMSILFTFLSNFHCGYFAKMIPVVGGNIIQ